LIGFKSAAAIKPTENYPNTKIAEIEKLLSERTSRKDAYDIAIKNGDQAFDEKKYDPALAHYRNALTLLPGEKYPVQKIDEITALVDQQKTLDENYKNSIAEADKQLNLNKFEEAIVLYTKASGYKPDETYPQQKITEAQGKLSDSKSKKEIYANAIANGNRLLSEFKYTEALDAYELSRSVNPFAEFPISKISEINFLLNKYDKDIEKGNKSLSSGNFNLALESYQAASTIKPSEQYPKDKIAETNAAITAHQKVTEKYNTVINTGDQLFAGKEYESALVAYQEAADLKTNEKYPSEQIAKINKLLSDLHSSDENYSKAIAFADRSFTDQKYTEAIASYTTALKIKPAETYPKSQIDKINILVAEQKKLDSEYLMAVDSADKLLAVKKYNEAILGYRKALALKSAEKYPLDKITETEKQLADLKTIRETYDKAITDGDKYYSAKDYPNSLASFKNAGSIKPGDAYSKQKITEIEAILDNDKAEGQRYQEAISQADKLFSDQKYSEALDPYQRASNIKPAEKYPQDQVVKINKLIAEQKKVDDDYQRLIKDGSAQLNEGKYTEARRLYSDAGILKPKEKLPKDIIAEIDGILADLKNKDQNYDKHISAGDVFYTGKKFAEAISSYNSASALKPGETYPKAQVEKINNLLAENKKLDESYNTLIVSADILYDRKKYSDAISTYRNALTLKPTEKYPAEKIADAEKQIADLKALEDSYTKAIADGDKKLAEKDYANALSAFKVANSVKQEELYPRQKITEIQAILDKNKAENDRYLDAIALADKFFTGEKYREALEPYQRASTIKPGEKYPHEQITRISQLLAEQKKLDDDYQNLITQAEDQLDTKKYDIARGLFTNAGNLKPKENLPKNKIAEIDGMLANIKLKDENYTKAINTAAGLYSVKNLAGSIKSYEEAQVIKPSEKFPAERIAAIRTELAAIDDRYVKAISIGDSKLASKNMMEALNAYQDALEIKPGEDYPESKIAEINSSLSAQKAEQDQLYDSYINEGDKAFETKDYSGAKSAFIKASGIKPAEAFPKQRIADINKIIEEIGLARRAEYNKAIGEADKLYNTKIFDQAIDAYEAASKINPDDSYPHLQISKIRKYMADHSIQDLFAQTLLISEGTERKFTFSAIEPRLRKNNYIVLKARSAGKSAPKVYLNYGKDNQKNGGIVLRSLDKTDISDYLIRISVQDKWYREDNNWISLFVETGDIEITKVQIAAGE
jgi:tetratricopeptide (TPR) repeat protein